MIRITCLICARKGSKGLKNKNIKKLNGKPLIEWTFNLAKKIKLFDKIILSTDSEKIISIAKKKKIKIPFKRPKNLAGDKVSEILVWKHALNHLKKIDKFPDILVVLPATSPLRKKEFIIKAIKKFQKEKPDALVSIKDSENNPYFNMVEIDKYKNARIVNSKKKFFRRQDAPKVYSLTTVCFILNPNFILKSKNLFDGNIGTIKFPKKYSIDIDDQYDFDLANFFIKNK